MRLPDVRYARSGDVAIAYQVIGEGPPDLVFARGFAGDLVSTWEQPLLARHVEGLASFSRVLMLDKRGTGLSDRVREVPTLETRMDDVRAVMDEAGSEAATLWTGSEGVRLAVLFGATYPERTSGLALLNPSAKGRRTPDYTWAASDEEWQRLIHEVREGWGTRAYFERLLADLAPTMVDDEEFREWYVWHMRRSLSPGAAQAFFRMMRDSDISDVLPSVRVPTLIMHKPDAHGPAEYFAQRISGSSLAEIPGMVGEYTWVNDDWHETTMRETARFVAGLPGRGEPDRVLATILFTDIVGSTEKAVSLGDHAWQSLLARWEAAFRRELTRFDGRELDTAGDGFFAAFDGPARAIRCAGAARGAARDLGLEVRSGLHSGECERHGAKLAGIAVHVGARVASLASPGEVLISQTVKDLVAGSELEFEGRGLHALKGVPGEWGIFALAAE